MLYNEMNRDVAYTRMIEQRKSKGRRNGRDSIGTILAVAFAYGLMALVILVIAFGYGCDFDCLDPRTHWDAPSNHFNHFTPAIFSAMALIALRVYRHKKPAGICGNIGMVLLSLTSIGVGWMLCYIVSIYSIAKYSLVLWVDFAFLLLVIIVPLSYWVELIYKAIRHVRSCHVASSPNIT